MGFRIRKRFKIAPGIHLNVSKGGISTSIGGKGATMNVGRKGVRTTFGIPGTGLSYTSSSSKAKSPDRGASEAASTGTAQECSNELVQEHRHVSFWLGVGIFLLPYVFAWFVLRPGYSKKAKCISFGWLFLFAVAQIMKQNS